MKEEDIKERLSAKQHIPYFFFALSLSFQKLARSCKVSARKTVYCLDAEDLSVNSTGLPLPEVLVLTLSFHFSSYPVPSPRAALPPVLNRKKTFAQE